MAVVLVQDCPHCGAAHTGFTLVGHSAHPNSGHVWRMLFTCNRCQMPVGATGISRHGQPPDRAQGDLDEHFTSVSTWPKPRPVEAPAHCPEAVARAFLQAENNIRRGDKDAAVAMDRRALEIATKLIAPDAGNLTLVRRIDRLAEQSLITPALREWAHELRTVGNDSLHEVDGVTAAEAAQTHELARFVLTYLFTLPAQVRASRAAREGAAVS